MGGENDIRRERDAPTLAKKAGSNHSDQTVDSPGPKQVDQMTEAVGIPRLEFEDQANLEKRTKSFQVFNLRTNYANMGIHVEGSGFSVQWGYPMRLDDTKYSEGNNINIDFAPSDTGVFNGTIVIDLSWPNEKLVRQMRIPIAGKAHQPGEPTWNERDAEAARNAKRHDEESMHQRDVSKARDELKDARSQQGEVELLQDEMRVDNAMQLLFNKRRGGLNAAKTNVLGFDRQEKVNHGALFKLAMLGIDMATAMIAGGVAKKVEVALEKYFTKIATQVVTPKVLASAISNGVKEGVKKVGSLPESLLAGKSVAASDVVVAAFFQAEEERLAGEQYERTSSVIDTFALLHQLLPDHRHEAQTSMAAIADTLVAESEPAAESQRSRSEISWIDYLAQANLGTRRDNDALADVREANQSPTDEGPRSQFDGLVDLQFSASLSHPEQPAKLTGARVRGLRRAVAEEIANAPLSTLPIPVRATGAPTQENAVTPLTVVRDEAGHVQFTDDAHLEWQNGTWFARHAGGPDRGTEAELRGAEKVMTELTARSLVDQGVSLHDDSKEK